MVSTEPPLPSRIRDTAEKSGNFLGQAEPGEFVRITGGPQCADGYTWWQVQTEKNLNGWTVEGDVDGYWLSEPPAADACKDIAPKSKLSLGQKVYVNNEPPLNSRVRLFPSHQAEILGEIAPGAGMEITGGPVCSDEYIWWQVQNETGLIGWTVEGDKTSDWLVTTLPNPCVGGLPMRLEVGQQAIVEVNSIVNNRLREAPGTDSKIIFEIPPGSLLKVTGGPMCENNMIWWEVLTRYSETGWTAEGDDKADWLIPVKGVTGKGKVLVNVEGVKAPLAILDAGSGKVLETASVEKIVIDIPEFSSVLSLAPNGTMLAYVKTLIDEKSNFTYEVWVKPIKFPAVDGLFNTTGKRISGLPAEAQMKPIQRLAWSENSEKLYADLAGEGFYELNPSGGEAKKIDSWPGQSDPRLLSPKEDKMLRLCPDYIGVTQNDDLFLCVTPAGGGEYKKVAELHHTVHYQPIWVDNDNFLILHGQDFGTDFYMGNSDGEDLRLITLFPSMWSPYDGSLPRMQVSPDKTLVLIANGSNNMIELHSMENLQNGAYAPTTLTRGYEALWLP